MVALTNRAKLLIGEAVLLFIIPFLPKSVLLLTDNIVVRILLLGLLLASSLQGPFVLLMTFIVVLALFGIRNHLKINEIVPPAIQQLSPANFEEPQVKIEQPSSEEAVQEIYEFAPQEDTGNNEFVPVGESIDEKVVLPSVEPDGNAGGIFPFHAISN